MSKAKRGLRAAALALSVCAVVSLAAGCQGNKGGTTSSGSSSTVVSDKPVTLSMLYMDMPGYPYNKDWPALQQMTKLTNVTLDMNVVPSTDFFTKETLLLNSGNVPDIITATYAPQFNSYAQNGVLLPISDYAKQMPNYQKFIKQNKYDAEVQSVTEPDGKYYAVPSLCMDQLYQNHAWFVRKDIFTKNNIAIPTTWDELYDACVKLKQLYPNSTPIINRGGVANLVNMAAASFGTEYYNQVLYDKKSDKWYFGAGSDAYKSLLTTLNKFMSAGLINKDFNTLDKNTALQRIFTGQGFVFADYMSNVPSFTVQGKAIDSNFEMAAVMPFKGPTGIAKVESVRRNTYDWMFPATVKSKSTFQTLLKFVDWMYSDDGITTFEYGQKGVTYNETNGKPAFTSDVTTVTNPSGKTDPKTFGVNNSSLTMVLSYDYWKKNFITENDAKIQDQMIKNNAIPELSPMITFSTDDQEQQTMLTKAVQDYVFSMTLKFIFGSNNLSTDWNQYLSECNSKGAQTLVDLYNKTWKAQKSK